MDKESVQNTLLKYIRSREELLKKKQFSEMGNPFFAGRGAEIMLLEQSLPAILTDILNYYGEKEDAND